MSSFCLHGKALTLDKNYSLECSYCHKDARESIERYKDALHTEERLIAIEIVKNYMPPYPRPGTQPKKFVVKHRRSNMFLRHSCGPIQGYFWDMYGDDFDHEEWALWAAYHAPVCPVKDT